MNRKHASRMVSQLLSFRRHYPDQVQRDLRDLFKQSQRLKIRVGYTTLINKSAPRSITEL